MSRGLRFIWPGRMNRHHMARANAYLTQKLRVMILSAPISIMESACLCRAGRYAGLKVKRDIRCLKNSTEMSADMKAKLAVKYYLNCEAIQGF